MKKRWRIPVFVGLGVAIGAALISVGSVGLASDHADSPKAVADPLADITDVYSFVRPEPNGSGGYNSSSHLVLVMNVNPDATTTTRLTPKVDYYFRVQRVTNTNTLALGTPYAVFCQVGDQDGGTQLISCNVAGSFATAVVGAAPTGTTSDKVRVWAGLRSDPAFFDKAAFNSVMTNGALNFPNTGTNAFQGKNVMSIVIEVDYAAVFNPGDAAVPSNMFAVSGETRRQN